MSAPKQDKSLKYPSHGQKGAKNRKPLPIGHANLKHGKK